MLVRERMKALGDHAKSSRQPPVKERKYAKADESAAKPDAIDETILESDATHDSAAAVLVDDETLQTVVHESELATGTLIVAAEPEPQPAAADDSATQASAVQEDDATSAAKRAIIHEWENWSALHSDELSDPNVAEYFFRHLEAKKSYLLNFEFIDLRAMVQKCIVG
jgi:hypothetical protein